MRTTIYMTFVFLVCVSFFWAQDSKETRSEKSAEYPGGVNELMNFIKRNKIYPQEARASKAEGKAVVKFMIDTTGRVNSPTVITSSGNSYLDQEALRVVSLLPTWSSAEMGGKKVACFFTLPIKFSIEEAEAILSKEQKSKSEKSNEYYDAGMKFFQKSNLNLAKEYFKKAYELNKQNINAAYNLGVVYHNVGMEDSACKVWNELRNEQKVKIADDLINKYCIRTE